MHMDQLALSHEDRTLALERIRDYLREERGDEVGELATLMLYDFIAERIGPLFYNEGIAAAQHLLLRFGDSLEAELDAAKRYEPRNSRPSAGPQSAPDA